MIKDLLVNKTAQERANLKAEEIAKLNLNGEHTIGGVRIEIISMEKIEGGVQVFARAFRGNKQIGFGKDGTVDIERFRLFNPPILVEDPNGDIIPPETEDPLMKGKVPPVKYREDPAEAIKQELARAINLVGKGDEKIRAGKIGNTTSTFYPSLNGFARNSNASFSTARDAATGNLSGYTTSPMYSHFNPDTGAYNIWRSFVLFDTSAISDTDQIDSGTLSLKPSTVNDGINDAYGYIGVVATTPASDSAIANADYDQFGTTKLASDVDCTALVAGTYSDFTLNTAGKAAVSKTGITRLGTREGHDLENQSVSLSPDRTSGPYWYTSQEAGTTNDPVLTIVHSVAPIAYTQTVTNTTTVTDNLSSQWNARITVTEQTALTDNVQAANAASTSMDVPVSDVVSTQVNYGIVITETASVSDLAVAVWSQNLTVTEQITMSDVASSSLIFGAVISETLSVSEVTTTARTGWEFRTKYGSSDDWTFRTKNT